MDKIVRVSSKKHYKLTFVSKEQSQEIEVTNKKSVLDLVNTARECCNFIPHRMLAVELETGKSTEYYVYLSLHV